MRNFLGKGLPYILIAISLLWGFVGVQRYIKHIDYPTTQAVITKIDQVYNAGREGYDHYVYVEYTVDGVTHETELGSYVTGYKVGKELEISYNPQDFDDIQLAGIGESLFFIGGALAVLAIGVGMIIKKKKAENNIE